MKYNIQKMFGVLKMWQMRLATYISMIQFIMVFYLFIAENTWMEWYYWFVLVTFICCSIIFFDVKFVFPGTLDYTFKKNPKMMDLKKQVSKNSQKLDLILKHLNIEYEESKDIRKR